MHIASFAMSYIYIFTATCITSLDIITNLFTQTLNGHAKQMPKVTNSEG